MLLKLCGHSPRRHVVLEFFRIEFSLWMLSIVQLYRLQLQQLQYLITAHNKAEITNVKDV